MIWPTIYVPSMSRVDRLFAPYVLPPEMRQSVVVVVPEHQVAMYALEHDLAIVGTPDTVRGIAATREWIMQRSEGRFLFQIDDDWTGLCIKPDCMKFGGLKRVERKPGMVEDCFGQLIDWLDRGFGHVSLSDRLQSARPWPTQHRDNGNYRQILGYDVEAVRRVGAKFDRVEVFEDLDYNLQLLRAGVRSRMSVYWSYASSALGLRGGCSDYRTEQVKYIAAKKLERLHPGLVKMVTKVRNGEPFISVRTKYAEAFCEAR